MKSLLKKNLKRFSKAKILCVGDIMLDEFIYGTVERISPEAPVPILLSNTINKQLGGAGNVARNISRIGGKVGIISFIGLDSDSKEILKLLNKEKNITPHLVKLKKYKLTTKKRFINNASQLLRVDTEETNFMNKTFHKLFIDKFKKEIKKYDTVIISDYNKGIVTPEIISEINTICKNKNKTLLVDPKKKDFSIYRNIEVITPNQKELSEAANRNLMTKAEVIKYARKLLNIYNFRYMIVTRAEKGMILISKDKEIDFPTSAKEVFDVSGAGDTVIAYIALGISSDIKIEETVQTANFAAGIVVGKTGTAVVNINDL
tara:strand:- start:1373 stop:2326 length:954 start_codon:yes stop_codon:yes gene_type:complete